jgi:hypothetical protein
MKSIVSCMETLFADGTNAPSKAPTSETLKISGSVLAVNNQSA